MKMQFNWINWQQVLLDDPRPSFHAKALGLFLHTYMNNKNDLAYPSIATIRGRMNIGSNSTVIKYTNELVELGYLLKERRFGKSVIYHANTPDLDSITSHVVLHEMNHSITPDELSVLHEVEPNNQENNQKNNQGEKKSKRFQEPTVSEVAEYCKERGNSVDAEMFVDFYACKGWLVGKNKMKDWKAAVRTWERNGNSRSSSQQTDYKENFL